MRKKQTKAAVRFAVAAMERATEGMPSETRDRYHDELVAEMYGLSALRRWRYAVGVAASAPAMRSALAPGAPPALPKPHRRLGCRTNTHHVWMTTHADDGALYRACARCGKEYIATGTAGVIGG
jgi:hypothetical protein